MVVLVLYFLFQQLLPRLLVVPFIIAPVRIAIIVHSSNKILCAHMPMPLANVYKLGSSQNGVKYLALKVLLSYPHGMMEL